MSLGSAVSTNLGLNHRAELIKVLIAVSILMAMTTSLVGPMTFLGFLVATMAYSIADTYSHRAVFPIAFLLGYVLLTGAYFVLRHIFYAQDRKSTRLNSSHVAISYAVFSLKR